MNRNFETLLAHHCAPLLFCKKPAALLAEKNLPKKCPWQLLRQKGFHIFRLQWRGQTPLTLIYHPDMLNATLSHKRARRALEEMGYPVESNWRDMLSFLRRRFYESEDFPHEVGFFLGYPPEDVIGFMECREDCKLCGQWKVFGDVEEAEALFAEYAHCRKTLLRHIENGGSIFTEELPALAG